MSFNTERRFDQIAIGQEFSIHQDGVYVWKKLNSERAELVRENGVLATQPLDASTPPWSLYWVVDDEEVVP